ncbi:MAG TPA: hypothetical protein DDY93_00865 [Dehalococcoidia bacterium]|nr:hypothetical protein [Dehalococcoidia bacterium]
MRMTPMRLFPVTKPPNSLALSSRPNDDKYSFIIEPGYSIRQTAPVTVTNAVFQLTRFVF